MRARCLLFLEQADRWRAAGAAEGGAHGPEMLLHLATQPGEGGSSFSAQVAVGPEAAAQPLLRKAGAPSPCSIQPVKCKAYSRSSKLLRLTSRRHPSCVMNETAWRCFECGSQARQAPPVPTAPSVGACSGAV